MGPLWPCNFGQIYFTITAPKEEICGRLSQGSNWGRWSLCPSLRALQSHIGKSHHKLLTRRLRSTLRPIHVRITLHTPRAPPDSQPASSATHYAVGVSKVTDHNSSRQCLSSDWRASLLKPGWRPTRDQRAEPAQTVVLAPGPQPALPCAHARDPTFLPATVSRAGLRMRCVTSSSSQEEVRAGELRRACAVAG